MMERCKTCKFAEIDADEAPGLRWCTNKQAVWHRGNSAQVHRDYGCVHYEPRPAEPTCGGCKRWYKNFYVTGAGAKYPICKRGGKYYRKIWLARPACEHFKAWAEEAKLVSLCRECGGWRAPNSPYCRWEDTATRKLGVISGCEHFKAKP